MANFGVTEEGFTIKGFDVILSESLQRARQMFGSDIDLTSTSVLRKIIEVTAAEDAELWKRLEDVYYSNFVSTAIGPTLELLGDDIGASRQQLFAQGEVTFKISNPLPGRQYILPEGIVLNTVAPDLNFYTTAAATLNENVTQITIPVQAFLRGRNLDAQQITSIDSVYAQIYLKLSGTTQITVSNAQPFTGGEQFEDDETYRSRLLGFPRTIWTAERVRHAAVDVEGVLDVLLSDPLGGVDVSQSYFNMFAYNQRLFSSVPPLGEPYFFTIVVAHQFGWPWRTQGNIPGIYERVLAIVDDLRPVGIHPNIVQADHIEVGVRARITIEPGFDGPSLQSLLRQRLATEIGALRLGGNVLFSQTMRVLTEQPGVVDVQDMHLRRNPAAFGRVNFGSVSFQASVQEAEVGENLLMDAAEIAIFPVDGVITDLEMVAR